VTIVDFLVQYRVQIVAVIFLAWFIYALYHTGKLKAPFRKPSLVRLTLPPEQQLAVSKSEVEKLQRENERLTRTLAEMKMEQAKQQIRKTAEEKIKALLPEKVFLFDPENQLVGRPVYYFGGVPLIQKKEVLNSLAEKHKFLNKLSPTLTRKLLDWLYFKGDTLYFYTAQLLPSGAWTLTATSKPAKKKRNYVKLPRFTLPFIILTSEHKKIDDLILNKWEVAKAGAAIHLSATFLGPFPIEEYSKLKRAVGWEEYGKT